MSNDKVEIESLTNHLDPSVAEVQRLRNGIKESIDMMGPDQKLQYGPSTLQRVKLHLQGLLTKGIDK